MIRRPWSSVAGAALVCALVAVGFHLNALGNEFAYDDVHILTENPEIQDIGNLPRLLTEPYWPGGFGQQLGLWRPAVTLSFGVQWWLFQDNGMPYHLVNVLVHGVVTVLVVLLIAELATIPVALLGGLVFAVHPVHVEAIANIVGLAELQAAVFFLAACLVHLRGGRALADERRYGVGRLLAVVALYLGAFLTKESAVTLPGVILLLDAARERLAVSDLGAYLRRRWALYGGMALAAVAVLAARVQVLGSVASPLGPLGADLLSEGVPRVWTVAAIWAHYVRLLVFPMDLASDYSPDVIPIELGWGATNTVGLVMALVVMAVSWLSWRARDLERGSTSARLIGFGILWFVITISPVSNVFFLAGVLLAERTLYLPSVGAVAVAGWLLFELIRERRRLGLVVTASVVLLMGARSWARTPTWESTVTVFSTMIEEYPQSGRSQWVLGDLFYLQGRVPESLRSYRIAIGILGGHYQIMTEIGKKLIGAQKHQAARFVLLKAWADEPEWGVAPGYLAISHFQEEEWAEAERYARASLAADPDDSTISHILASALAAKGSYQESIPWRESSIRNGEGHAWEQWIALARLRLSVGDSTGAVMARDSALTRAKTPEQVRQIGIQFAPYEPVVPPL